MIARFGLLKRSDKLTPKAFDEHWQTTHGDLAAQFPGLRAYYQHLVLNNAHADLDYPSGSWQLDGMSELHFDDLPAMQAAVDSQAFTGALNDEDDFLGDIHLVACKKQNVIQPKLDGPYVKRMTLLRRKEGMSEAEFDHEWLKVHADLMRGRPNVLGYVQNKVVARYSTSRTEMAGYEDVPIDGIAELYFENAEDAGNLFSEEIAQHAGVFLEEFTPFMVETRTIVAPE